MIRRGRREAAAIRRGRREVQRVYRGRRLVWEKPVTNQYLTFSSPSSFTIATANSAKNWDGTLEYSTDTDTWTEWDGTTTLSAVADNGTYFLYVRGVGNTTISGRVNSFYWAIAGADVACSGNIESLLDHATVETGGHPTMNAYCFGFLFRDCTALVSAPDLSAVTLSNHCYYNMFTGCRNLAIAPQLPATTLAPYCYSQMFHGCRSLRSTPELPATTLAEYCYYLMFYGCDSLESLPELPATELETNCYRTMFGSCDLIKISETQDTTYTVAYRIPSIGTGVMAEDALRDMFNSTGGTFAGTPQINTTYYTSNTVIS